MQNYKTARDAQVLLEQILSREILVTFADGLKLSKAGNKGDIAGRIVDKIGTKGTAKETVTGFLFCRLSQSILKGLCVEHKLREQGTKPALAKRLCAWAMAKVKAKAGAAGRYKGSHERFKEMNSSALADIRARADANGGMSRKTYANWYNHV